MSIKIQESLSVSDLMESNEAKANIVAIAKLGYVLDPEEG